jgi:hypothetical protein
MQQNLTLVWRCGHETQYQSMTTTAKEDLAGVFLTKAAESPDRTYKVDDALCPTCVLLGRATA